jgi:hypothetical protein
MLLILPRDSEGVGAKMKGSVAPTPPATYDYRRLIGLPCP